MSYASYQGISSPWLIKAPSHWAYERGKRILMRKKELNTGNLESNVLSLTLKGVINNNADKPIGLSPKDYATYQLFYEGDLVFKLIDLENFQTSRVGLVHERGIMSSAYIRLVFRDADVNIRYFYLQYYDLYLRRVFNGLGGGVRSTLSSDDLLDVKILIPPRTEQDQIVHFLDWKVSQVNRLINAKKKQIGLLQEQKRGLIKAAVTMGGVSWQVRRIKSIAAILRGKFNHRPRNDPDYYDGEYPFIQTGDVAQAGKYIKAYKQTLNERGYSVSKMFPKGTLAMTIAANIGDVSILSFDACFPDSIVGFIPIADMDLNYLYYALFAKKEEFLLEAPVNTQANLSVERVGAMTVYMPPLSEQKSIVKGIEASTQIIDGAIGGIKTEIALLQEYRTRLISDVVTGKLDVRGVVVPEYEVVEETADASIEAVDEEDESEVEEV